MLRSWHVLILVVSVVALRVSDAAAQRVYWTESGKIRSADASGSDIRDLVATGLSQPCMIAVTGGIDKMYWAVQSDLKHSDLNGQNTMDLLTTAGRIHGIALGAEGDICWLPRDPGPCDGICPRLFYNIETGQCEPFTWGCCYGNANNFLTLEHLPGGVLRHCAGRLRVGPRCDGGPPAGGRDARNAAITNGDVAARRKNRQTPSRPVFFAVLRPPRRAAATSSTDC